MNRTFSPGVPTVKITAGASSSRVALSPHARTVRVVNTASAPVFLSFGNDAALAVTAADGMPILAGATETFTKGATSYVAAICPAGAGDVFFTGGEGL